VKEIFMTCNVILTPQNGRFIAHVAELPDCKAEAESRDQALALIQKRLEEFVKRIEIVQLEIPNLERKLKQSGKQASQDQTAKPPKLVQFPPMVLATDKTVHLETPWEYAGIFKDDPTWWPMIEEIERRRDRQKIPTTKKRRKK
jgi:predicted RNase H-like HicB family nuclease